MALAAPLKPLRCNNPDCTLPEGGRCARLSEFPEPLSGCVDLARVGEATSTATSGAEPTAPWSGRALVPTEVEAVLWRAPARLVGLVGPRDAGKTTLLTSFFLQLANGQRGDFPYRFASSLTLHDLRELTERAGSWSGNPEDNVVDHTTIADESKPRSFLHLGLRPENPSDNRHIDLLLSDLPGEWFKAWSQNVDNTSNQRMAFIRRCDAFIVLADAAALMGQGGGRIDSETSILIRRIAEATQELTPRPPLALVFSKFDRILQDIEPPTPQQDRTKPEAWGALGKRTRRIWPALEEARRAGLTCDIFPVSAFPHALNAGQPVGVLEPFIYAMRHADRREPWPPLHVPIPEGARGFATLRRWRDTP